MTHSRLFGTLMIAAIMCSACRGAAPAASVVDVKAADGVLLKATLFAAATPGPGVLMLHQCDEQRTVWNTLGVRLMRAGITALSVDYRGYGESGGTPHDKMSGPDLSRMMNEQWPSDIDSAYATLLRVPGVDAKQIGVAGGSCGAGNAVAVAMRHHDVRGLALLAGPLGHDARAFIAASGAPPLFLGAAADDQYFNFVEIQGWYGALSTNAATRSIEYPNGGHAAIVFRMHPDLADSITHWFGAVFANDKAKLPTTNGRFMDTAVVAILRDLDAPGGAARVTQKLAVARASKPDAQLFPEYFANQLGYDHMLAHDAQGAIAIMKLNTVAYPTSPNAEDSLGDVYLAAGDTASMLQTARRTLALLDTDTTDTASRRNDLRGAAEGKLRQFGQSQPAKK